MVTVTCPNCNWTRIAPTPALADDLFREHVRTHIVTVESDVPADD